MDRRDRRDGYNLAYAVTHETFEDVVEYLVPELQRRGALPTAYRREHCAKSCSAAGPICRKAIQHIDIATSSA